ncbi:hypothetical protein JOS77_13065 [Chromobacterium haemolyticum]|nr:hypothetical protein JOS77_13065 [Chromobacterium haemolyticum]
MLKELEHDRLQAALLRPYRQSALEQAAQALQDKQEQAGSRIGALIGSHEQLALFSIAGFALAVWEKTIRSRLGLEPAVPVLHTVQPLEWA